MADESEDRVPFGALSGLTKAVSTWTRASSHAMESVVEANRATLAAFGVETEGGDGTAPEVPDDGEPDWRADRSVADRHEMGVGDWTEFSKILDDADVKRFALASGDTNPVHVDDEYAEDTRFQERIVHGTLVSGLISAALARFPGTVIYLSQDTTFLEPVVLGDRLTARCEVVEDLGDHQYRLTTTITDDEDTTIIDGEAIVLVDPVPEDELDDED